ncbi:formylglycine-generating enzyme family protein [Aquimarina sediminis]|uniref:formylglycine-generating enzyme family protein n=1 Tax=Aquimarina sediminis TaxID=2070536 RepID=UPI000CA05917|nr:formylglycine-generating enzyme family protein [Aquimarina sediminis]
MNVSRISKLLLLFGFLAFSGCKTDSKKQLVKKPKVGFTTQCIRTDDLMGKEYLDAKFLSIIDSISTSKEKSKDYSGMVFIKGGTFEMGGDFPEGSRNMQRTALPQGDEMPKHSVTISDFYMDEHEVTISQFLEFVKATNYKTVAEYNIDWEELKKQVPIGTPRPEENALKAGALVFHFAEKSASKDNLSNWWSFVNGSSWKNPDGKSKNLNTLLDHPVTQISWYDAMAYAKWVNKRLPTEAEFEYAMRGGKANKMYPWGNQKLTSKSKKGNFLQGEFPYNNTAEDGFMFVAPVKSFPPNSYGLYDIAGNVWEWTNDWYGANYYKILKDKNIVVINPTGPNKTIEVYNPNAINKVVRGGSFLCHDSWCSGYRNSRRMRLSPDSGMQHVGFRLVRNEK